MGVTETMKPVVKRDTGAVPMIMLKDVLPVSDDRYTRVCWLSVLEIQVISGDHYTECAYSHSM